MASRKKFPSDRPTEKPPMLDEPFQTEPPTDLQAVTEAPPSAPITMPDLPYFVCPSCRANNPEACDVCMGTGIIDRDVMDEWKQRKDR